jgi:hypothetical protein
MWRFGGGFDQAITSRLAVRINSHEYFKTIDELGTTQASKSGLGKYELPRDGRQVRSRQRVI